METTPKSPEKRRSVGREVVPGATDETLEMMLAVLGDRRLSPAAWMRECRQRGVGLRAFCEGVPLLSHSTLIALSIISDSDGDHYRYWRILK
jgi:hypothetical protein